MEKRNIPFNCVIQNSWLIPLLEDYFIQLCNSEFLADSFTLEIGSEFSLATTPRDICELSQTFIYYMHPTPIPV